MDPGISLIHLIHSKPSKSIELSIAELAEKLCIEEDNQLDIALNCIQELDRLNLISSPSLKDAGFDEPRIISVMSDVDTTVEDVKNDLKIGENQTLEFKSTYIFNIKQNAAEPEKPVHKLSSASIEYEVYKTICAFLNQEGGKLYIGVKDDGSIYGIEKDFKCISDRATYDDWELKLRSGIRQRFKDGNKISNYIVISPFEVDSKRVIQVIVSPRKEESFVKNNNGEFEFRMRQGNESPKYSIDELPVVVLRRRGIL